MMNQNGRVSGMNSLDPYADKPQTENSLTVGERGPVLLEDTVLHETLGDFVSSTKRHRVVHTKGFGAMGYFEPYHSMQNYTKLSFLQRPGVKVPVTTRFSLAVSNMGTPDTSRNVRGFSTKFYTEEGVFDLLCNHIPVFLVRDAMRFPESIKSFQPSPVNNLGDPQRFWDFVARTPEATHFITWLYSDVGTIKSLRKIRAYSVNTYVWRNFRDEILYIKYHWLPYAGQESITAAESVKLAGENPDIAGQDLYDTIAAGTPVEYELCIQAMKPDQAALLPFDPLDDTKTWSESSFPLIRVGRLVLNKNPDNFQNQVEDVAFSPANLLPGAELSWDKMLQGRSTVYWDAQRHRLGNDFRSIPINYQADFNPSQLVTSSLDQEACGVIRRTEYSPQDNFEQAGERYMSLNDTQKSHLVDNIAADLHVVNSEAQDIVMGYFTQASPEMAARIKTQMEFYSKT